MSSIKIADEHFILLHRAGWSIGDTAFTDGEGTYWLVYGTQGGYEIHIKDRDRGEAWNRACREAEALGLIEPL
jgi:hypothetical protein